MDRTGISALDCRCKTYRKDMVSIERRSMSYLEAILNASKSCESFESTLYRAKLYNAKQHMLGLNYISWHIAVSIRSFSLGHLGMISNTNLAFYRLRSTICPCE